jgi:hypothetical protein
MMAIIRRIDIEGNAKISYLELCEFLKVDEQSNLLAKSMPVIVEKRPSLVVAPPPSPPLYMRYPYTPTPRYYEYIDYVPVTRVRYL